MGGTRFSAIGDAVRVGRTEHGAITNHAMDVLAALGIEARGIPHLRDKADFGDVDLIATRTQVDAVGDQAVADALGAVASSRGDVKDPTYSMLLEGRDGLVQLDLICVDDDLLDFATSHMSYGEASPLSGIVARQFGVKLGMHGLLLLEDDARGLIRSRIDLSHAQALDLIGLDPEAHARGFDDLPQVFAWIASGRYFDPGIFDVTRMTNRARLRALKRPAYSIFLEWMQDNGPPARYDWGARGTRTEEWRQRIARAHPEAVAGIERARASRATRDPVRSFFSGEAVSQATGVRGSRLGHLMNAIRGELGMERLMRMAEEMDHAGLEREARRIAAKPYLPVDFVEDEEVVCG